MLIRFPVRVFCPTGAGIDQPDHPAAERYSADCGTEAADRKETADLPAGISGVGGRIRNGSVRISDDPDEARALQKTGPVIGLTGPEPEYSLWSGISYLCEDAEALTLEYVSLVYCRYYGLPMFWLSLKKESSDAIPLKAQPNGQEERPKAAVSRLNDQEERPKAAVSRPNDQEERPKAAVLRPNDQEERPKAAVLRPNDREERSKAAVSRPNDQEKRPKAAVFQPVDQKEKPKCTAPQPDGWTVREMTKEDIPALRELYRDPQAARFLEHPTGGDDSPEAWIAWLLAYQKEQYASDLPSMWTIADLRTDRMIGRFGLEWKEENGREGYFLGYALLPEYRGKGILEEIWKVFSPLLKERWEIGQVYLSCEAENIPSMRLAKRLGFCREEEKEEFAESGSASDLSGENKKEQGFLTESGSEKSEKIRNKKNLMFYTLRL